jgi:hypothetical protein
MTWNEDGILELIANALEHQSSIFDAEQAVRGIDCLTENELRDRIRESLIAADIQAVHEERYPDAKCIERQKYGHRCDLVLLPSDTPSDLKGDPDWCAAGYWLEIKRVSQFLESGPNWWYEHALLEAIPQDIYKLAKDSKIFYAGLVLILFSANSQSGNYDLKIWKQRAMEKGCPVGVPRIHQFSITNRLGNEHAFIALFPLRRL